jgi:hypothetical protein
MSNIVGLIFLNINKTHIILNIQKIKSKINNIYI